MGFKYEIPQFQIAAEKKYLTAAIYKLLPYKEEGYECLDGYFESVLQRLNGFNIIAGLRPEIITIMSLVEHARQEKDMRLYRKAVLDACGLVASIKERD